MWEKPKAALPYWICRKETPAGEPGTETLSEQLSCQTGGPAEKDGGLSSIVILQAQLGVGAANESRMGS